MKATESGRAEAWGWFSQGCNCDLVPGDTVHVTSTGGFDAVLELISMTAQANPETDVVTGRITGAAFPGIGSASIYSSVRQ